jgi:pyruvate dehydrogenase (quinone)
VLLDVVTNPDEISVPGRVSIGDAWGVAIAKVQETVRSART